MGKRREYSVGMKRLARAINEAIRETGWVVGIKRKSSGEIFLRPRSDVFDIHNFAERMRRGVEALRLAVQRSREFLQDGHAVRRALLILPLVPAEWVA